MSRNSLIFSYTNSVFVYWNVWFYLRIKTFINFRGPCVFVCVVTVDIRVDLTFQMMKRKYEKKVLEIENIRNVTDDKKQKSQITDLFKL